MSLTPFLAQLKSAMRRPAQDSAHRLYSDLIRKPMPPDQRAAVALGAWAGLGKTLLCIPILFLWASAFLTRIVFFDFLPHALGRVWERLRGIPGPRVLVGIYYPPEFDLAQPGTLLMEQLDQAAFNATPKPWQAKFNRFGLFRSATKAWRQSIRRQHEFALEQGLLGVLEYFTRIANQSSNSRSPPQRLSQCHDPFEAAFIEFCTPLNHLAAWVEFQRALSFLLFGGPPPRRLAPSPQMTERERDIDRLIGEILARPLGTPRFTVDAGFTGPIAEILNHIIETGAHGPLQARIDSQAIEQSAPARAGGSAKRSEATLTRL